jgi:F-type H+-transporting ATPase subunit delta
MQSDALANVYAKSLYELASNAGGQDKITEVLGELEQLCELRRSDKSFREFLASPVIDREARSSSLRKIFSDRITDLTLRFMLVLNANGRLGHLEAIADAYDHLVQAAFGRIEVDVFTAAPIDRTQVEALKAKLQQALGREPVLHTYTDTTMLGGLKLRIGDQLIDGSVANKLRRMKRDLLTGGAARLRDQIARFVEDRN